MPDFIPGLKLSELFYREVVGPILDEAFPELEYSAALIGPGSDVLGYDTEMSTDHDWGPRLKLFIGDGEVDHQRENISDLLSRRLPHRFYGYSTHFSEPIFNEDDHGTQLRIDNESGPVNHRVEIASLRSFFKDYLDDDINIHPDAADWLTFPQQKLLSITSGAVYHDALSLESIRQRFAYYPHDIWLYLMAAGWSRISEEEHLMPRAAYVGDELGSAILGSRLVRDIMRLCFLIERRYAPYAKWFGTAFMRLKCAPTLAPILWEAQRAETWQQREKYLCAAYEILAAMHNALKLTDPLPEKCSPFFGRPFQVIWAGYFTSALVGQIRDEQVAAIAAKTHIGSLDLFSDNTDMLEQTALRQKMKALYA